MPRNHSVRHSSTYMTAIVLAALPTVMTATRGHAAKATWPPTLPGATNGTVTFTSSEFLTVPNAVQKAQQDAEAAPFTVAKTPPTVDLAYHGNLGPDAVSRRLWSSWGDICVAGDGSVYCGIGDHGNAVGGDARCFLYRWNPQAKVLSQIIDMNEVVPSAPGQPAWSKVHARIDEGPDGTIYFCCTLNDGSRAENPEYHWTKQLPGGQLYRYDPQSSTTTVFANLPPRRCTATSLLDRKRNIWWCNLEAGGEALWGLDLKTKRVVYKAPDGSMGFNRNFALARDGAIYFNGAEGHLWKYDPDAKDIRKTNSRFADSPGMRCSTRESRDGAIYGITHRTSRLFRYRPAEDELKLLGFNWLTGEYTTVCVLSPDERFLYYLPGSHGKAFHTGTPVIQYEVATGRRKVLAFLAAATETRCGYVPGGSYGVKLSADGGTLYVNFNGHATDKLRPEGMRPIGFGLCAFAAIHIPESER